MIDKMRRALAKDGKIAIVWSIEDVKSVRPDLLDTEAWEVLLSCERGHDASMGISWMTIEAVADVLYPKEPSNV